MGAPPSGCVGKWRLGRRLHPVRWTGLRCRASGTVCRLRRLIVTAHRSWTRYFWRSPDDRCGISRAVRTMMSAAPQVRSVTRRTPRGALTFEVVPPTPVTSLDFGSAPTSGARTVRDRAYPTGEHASSTTRSRGPDHEIRCGRAEAMPRNDGGRAARTASRLPRTAREQQVTAVRPHADTCGETQPRPWGRRLAGRERE